MVVAQCNAVAVLRHRLRSKTRVMVPRCACPARELFCTTMKAQTLGLSLLLSAAPAALAVPSSELQHVLTNIADYADAATGGLFGTVAKGVSAVLDDIEHVAEDKGHSVEEATEKWVNWLGRKMIKQNGLTCTSAAPSLM